MATKAATNNSSSPLTAEEAVQRAREIAARLSGQPIPSTAPANAMATTVGSNSSTAIGTVPPHHQQQLQTTAEDDGGITVSKVTPSVDNINIPNNDTNSGSKNNETTSDGAIKKRKRWGIMPADDLTTTSTAPIVPPNLAILESAAAEAALQARAKALAAVAKAIASPLAAGTAQQLNAAAAAAAAMKAKPPPVSKRVWVTSSMLSDKDRPAAHFVAYTSRHFDSILAKLNAEAETRKKEELLNSVATSGKNKDDKGKDDNKDDFVTIEFKGKGSSDRPPLLGMPEEPLHVYIHGPKLLVEQAEMQIEDLLEEAKTAPIEEDAINARLAAEGALTLLTGGSSLDQPMQSVTSYKPASVAQLIGQANIPYEQRILDANAVLMEETIGVPNGIVGYIIGRGGENIASMQSKTGCKVQIQKEHELQPGQTERIITLQATSKDMNDACRAIIETMVAERIRAVTIKSSNNGNTNNRNNNNNNNNGSSSSMNLDSIGGMMTNTNSTQSQSPSSTLLDPVRQALSIGHKLVEVDVPDADVGLCIGKGGSTIKMIQEQTGATIQVPKTGNVDNPAIRTLQITCPTEQGALAAKEMVENVLKTKPGYEQQMQRLQQRQGQQPPHHPHIQQQQPNVAVPECSIQVMIPDKDVGLCIGRQGCVIKYMQGTTGTKVQIPPTVSQPGDTHRTATILGPSLDACNYVRQLIERIIAEQSSMSIMAAAQQLQQQQQQQGGGYPQQQQSSYAGHGSDSYQQHNPHHQQHYPNPYAAASGGTATTVVVEDQQAYSAEWAAYHAAVAAQQQQQQQQQQLQQQQQQQQHAPVPVTGGAAGGYVEQSTTSHTSSSTAAAAVATTTTTTAPTTVDGQPSAEAYYEQFFRYAYYYGEDAARTYYGAWSPPVGTINPYGINPNLQQPQPQQPVPAAAEVPSTTPPTTISTTAATIATSSSSNDPLLNGSDPVLQHAVAEAAAVAASSRETSRRQVSNLPAWMTKK